MGGVGRRKRKGKGHNYIIFSKIKGIMRTALHLVPILETLTVPPV